VVAAPKVKTFHAPGTTGARAWEETTPKNSRDSPLGGADVMGIFITINPHDRRIAICRRQSNDAAF